MGDVSVSIPARPDFVHVLRSVVASVAARANFTYDEIDDLRLAVDEACAQLLAFAAPSTRLTVRIARTDGGGLEVVASIDEPAPTAWPPDGTERTLAWQVLSALTDEARFDRVGDAPALRLRKRPTPATAPR